MGRVKRTRSTIAKSGFKLEYPRRLTLLIGRVTLEIRIRFVYCEVNELCKAAAITHIHSNIHYYYHFYYYYYDDYKYHFQITFYKEPQCKDRDECQLGTHRCDTETHTCINKPGSFVV